MSVPAADCKVCLELGFPKEINFYPEEAAKRRHASIHLMADFDQVPDPKTRSQLNKIFKNCFPIPNKRNLQPIKQEILDQEAPPSPSKPKSPEKPLLQNDDDWKNTINCAICKAPVSSSRSSKLDHISADHSANQPLFTCFACDFTSHHVAAMRSHVKIVHGKRLKCFELNSVASSLMDKCFPSPSAPRSKEPRVEIKEEVSTKDICKLCGYQCRWIKRPEERWHHVITCHLKTKLFYCPLCGLGSEWQKSIILHGKTSHPEQKKLIPIDLRYTPYVQEMFPKCFEGSFPKIKRSQCTVRLGPDISVKPIRSCPREVPAHPEFKPIKQESVEFEAHVTPFKLRSPPRAREFKPTHYKCQKCNKTYASIRMLEDHMQVHLGLGADKKLFKCTECGKGLTTAKSLTRHRRKHTGKGLFKCPNNCGKEYIEKTGLTRHLAARCRKCK